MHNFKAFVAAVAVMAMALPLPIAAVGSLPPAGSAAQSQMPTNLAERACATSSRIDALALPGRIDAASACSRSGVIVQNGLAGAAIPAQAGMSIAAFAHHEEGVDAVVVTRHPDGSVEVEVLDETEDSEAHATGAQQLLGNPECTANSYLSASWKLGGNYSWRYFSVGAPSNLTTSQVTNELNASFQNWTNMDDNCSFPDVIPYAASYAGTTTSPPDIIDGVCSGMDSTNEIGFGTLTGASGVTCVSASNGILVSADMEFTNSGSWFVGAVPAGCSGKRSLENTATHEFGHVVGARDVADSLVTMYQSTVLCSREKTTLACGDYRLAVTKYGSSGTC